MRPKPTIALVHGGCFGGGGALAARRRELHGANDQLRAEREALERLEERLRILEQRQPPPGRR